MLSPERAADVYGVVFDQDGGIDEPRTADRREKQASARTSDFNLCGERARQDHVWPMAVRRQLATLALSYEQRIRSQLVLNVHHRMMAEGQRVSLARLEQVLEEEAVRLTGARRVVVSEQLIEALGSL
jgi:N-methylhydantoinase B